MKEANQQCNFEQAITLYQNALRSFPDLESEKVLDQAAYTVYLLLLRTLGSGDLSGARKNLARLDEILARNKIEKADFSTRTYLDLVRNTLDKHTALGEIHPQYTQKVLVIFIIKSEAHQQYPDGRPCDIQAAITSEQKTLTSIYVDTLKTLVETYSDGNLSLELLKVSLDATITDFDVPSNKDGDITPVYDSITPYPSDLIYQQVVNGDVDTIIWYYPSDIHATAWGGKSYFPLIPYHWQLNIRGFSELQVRWMQTVEGNGLFTISHEFMHSLQSKSQTPVMNVRFTKEDTEKWKTAYGWTEMDPVSNYWWQFHTFLSAPAERNGGERGYPGLAGIFLH